MNKDYIKEYVEEIFEEQREALRTGTYSKAEVNSYAAHFMVGYLTGMVSELFEQLPDKNKQQFYKEYLSKP